jgi:hypothetical protein
LEVVEGSYLFTLRNIINKRFEVIPGGSLRWFGDPYAAEIDLEARYGLRTSPQPLIPHEPELAMRTDVDLILGLEGNLLRPEIRFDIALPNSSQRAQALVSEALVNEEARNRQAVSLLVLQQFLSADPFTMDIGSTGVQENSGELIASQLSNWLSGMNDDLDVGLDYSQDVATGEQAIAVALSTRLLNDRLHLSGSMGTSAVGTSDPTLQDMHVRYDLVSDGSFQITGYTTTDAEVPGQMATSTQGIGLVFRHEFNRFRDLFRRAETP